MNCSMIPYYNFIRRRKLPVNNTTTTIDTTTNRNVRYLFVRRTFLNVNFVFPFIVLVFNTIHQSKVQLQFPLATAVKISSCIRTWLRKINGAETLSVAVLKGTWNINWISRRLKSTYKWTFGSRNVRIMIYT